MQEGGKKILTINACLIPSQRANYFGISCWFLKNNSFPLHQTRVPVITLCTWAHETLKPQDMVPLPSSYSPYRLARSWKENENILI